ncbi:methyltransferase domain-containing protein, partial [Arthrospira platensis SPKY2]
GASSFVLGQSGAHVIGIEGRADSVRRAEYVRDQLGFKNVEFYVGNVMNRYLWHSVDAVFAAGILYHLDRPFQFLDLIGEFSRQGVFFCTHCAPENQEQFDRSNANVKKVLKNDLHAELFHDQLIEVMTYKEPADVQEIQENGKRRHPRSSVGTNISVWLTQEGLVKAMTTLDYRYHQKIQGNLETMRFR